MRPNFSKLMRWAPASLLALATWAPTLAEGAAGGNRIRFPDRPMQVFNTNFPSRWASSNLASVPITAGGNGVVSNVAGLRRYPNNIVVNPKPEATTNFLAYSSFGHTVTAVRPDFYLGDQIVLSTNDIPAGMFLNWSLMRAANQSLNNAIYEPSAEQIYATAGGPAEVAWVFTDKNTGLSITNTRIYQLSGTPARRAYRIYWTEPPYNAPTVSLPGRFVKFNWNSDIPAPVTNGNVVRGLYLDGSGQLHAAPGTNTMNNPLQGMVVMQYFKTGDLLDQVPGGVVVVEVRRPEINTLAASVGDRLLPKPSPYGYQGLTAKVTQGLNSTPAYVYQHQGQYTHSPKHGWAFAIRPSTDEPWMIEVYWQEADLMGTLWPYEADWYAASWPDSAQPFVRGSAGNLGADVLVDTALSPKLMDAQDPPGHASLSAQGVFTTKSEGYSLLQFTANDNVWFQAVRSVYDINQRIGADPLRWPIGTQLQPVLSYEALYFDGASGFATVTNFPPLTNEWTLECWFKPSNAYNDKFKPLFSRSRDSNSWDFLFGVDGDGYLTALIGQTNTSSPCHWALSANAAVTNGGWYHAALAVSSNEATLYLNGAQAAQLPLDTTTAAQIRTGATSLCFGWDQRTNYFAGQIDEMRVWAKALSDSEIALASRHSLLGDVQTNLVAYYPVESEGSTQALLDVARGNHSALLGAEFVSPGVTLLTAGAGFSANHGYIYDPANHAPYNSGRYQYASQEDPTAQSYIFGVNSGEIEVWWARAVQQTDMPNVVYFPAWSCVYKNVWATNNAPEIVLASNQGSPAFESGDTVSIYTQNEKDLPGYNPNEEHALIGQDESAWVAYALRDDLNTPQSSPPFVLVDYTDRYGHPLMNVYRVVRTNAEFPLFAYERVVGYPLKGPSPLDLLPNVRPTSATRPQTWRDRNLTWWSAGAGPGDDTAVVLMTNYYPMQVGFWFPSAATQPEAGTPIPWLPVDLDPAMPTNGSPMAVAWTLSWPTNPPGMKVGQTLAHRSEGGLPEIWDQASVDVAYQQSSPGGDTNAISVQLFDPSVAQDVDLPRTLDKYGFTTGPGGNSFTRLGMTYFQNLPPDLSDRFYYDPARKKLRFIGRLNEPATGVPWLLVNRLTERQRSELKTICSGDYTAEWNYAIDRLATDIKAVTDSSAGFDHLALAAVGKGAGYVTIAFNNSTNLPPGLPIDVRVIEVKPELYTGFVIPLKDPLNLLSEQMNMLFSESFAGNAGDFEFQWVALDPPSDGTVPDGPPLAPPFAQEDGLTRLRIGGQGATLKDLINRFFTVRYRATTNSPAYGLVGPGWSDYTEYGLAEGWVQRVMFSITPFEQRLRDLYENPVNTRVSMIQQAGKPYVGDVALNMGAVDDVGLIELYQTVLNRAQRLSLDLGINSPAVNQQLLLAVSRLHGLYMLLGNEAYADALDPTIGFGSTTVINNGAVLPLDYGAFSSSMFCFQNQVPTLLDEELALLRGRGTPTLAPGVANYPFYNRLVWNFTRGLDAGEVAYAVNYNIHNSGEVIISAETAAGLYPQGHGDAYGHYLSALKGYYHLLRNPNFGWGDPSITSLLMGYQTISADYDDESRFAESAAALARTGVEIARRSSRKAYSDSADGGGYAALNDSEDAQRAWGVTEWVGRAGMGAFYNWAVAQSLLSTSRVDVVIEGSITSIDRSTVKSLREISTQYTALQRELDQVDRGLNPLGLARGAIPFDISPAEVDAGKTHFEQVYARASGALANAQTTFDAVQQTTRLLRQQSESALQFQEATDAQEIEYNQRLIEVFGSPYPDDIGTSGSPPGIYAQGYGGPDLFHFMYMDIEALGFDKSTDIKSISVTNYLFRESDLIRRDAFNNLSNDTITVSFSVAANGLQVKPAAWQGQRPAEGEIQQAYREFLVALLDLRSATIKYKNDVERLNAGYGWYAQGQGWYDRMNKQKDAIVDSKKRSIQYAWSSAVAETAARVFDALLSYGQIHNTLFAAATEGTMGFNFTEGYIADPDTIPGLWFVVSLGISAAASEALEAAKEIEELILEKDAARNDFAIQDHEMRQAILDQARNQNESANALLVALQKASDAEAGFQSAIAKGERLLTERESFRTSAAARINASRYNDMAFRIFRNDALRRYSDAFELAARYTYLAAKAYDYETALLPGDTAHDPGTEFMDQIVRTRTLGRVVNGQPALGAAGIGEPGLSDTLARMSANWNVLRGRLSFNNPQTETGRFSLRTELFRILPGAEGDSLWRQKLEASKVPDLLSYADFRRSCLPFASQSGLKPQEPGLVIEFASTIDFAKNFFGRDLAGGDNAYDSSHFATKVRSIGVWFSNYDRVTDGSQNIYLANQPRIYLMPLGQDVMRSPTGSGETLRTWQVLDQAIPVPFPITASDVSQPDWIPLYDTLTSPWAEARRYPSQRAYHDHGFNLSEMINSSRLVGRSVWNSRWVLIIPAGTLNNDRARALDWFIYGANGTNGVTDIKLSFQTYSYSGN